MAGVRRFLACLPALLLLTACTGEDTPSAGVGPSSAARVPVATAKPTVTVPTGAAPTTLVSTDLVVGTGDAVLPGQVASVHYVGVLYRNGEQFDSSWDRGSTFQFEVGAGRVIEGWDKGVLGMRVGGRRRLVIPPAQAYGADPTHELAKETLVFVVDVLGVGGSPAGAGGG